MSDQPIEQRFDATRKRDTAQSKLDPEYSPEALARIAASWQRISEYDPRSEVKVHAYDQLDVESKTRLDAAAHEAITIMYNLASMSMQPSTLKAFRHPPVYALLFALHMDNFPDIVDSIIRYSRPEALRADVKTLMDTLNTLLDTVKEVPNKTLHPYLIEQAIAYIPTHPFQRIGDLVESPEGFGASADRDTEDLIFGGEA
jgi:hypothetical protein